MSALWKLPSSFHKRLMNHIHISVPLHSVLERVVIFVYTQNILRESQLETHLSIPKIDFVSFDVVQKQNMLRNETCFCLQHYCIS